MWIGGWRLLWLELWIALYCCVCVCGLKWIYNIEREDSRRDGGRASSNQIADYKFDAEESYKSATLWKGSPYIAALLNTREKKNS